MKKTTTKKKFVKHGGGRTNRVALSESERNTLFQREEARERKTHMLLDLRRLPLCSLAVFSRRSRASRASSTSMGSALGTPAAATEALAAKQRPTSSPPITVASAIPSKDGQLVAAPSPSSPLFRLLESPATRRDLLPKKTPLGELLVLKENGETRTILLERDNEKTHSRPPPPFSTKKLKKGAPLPPVVHAVLDPQSEARLEKGRVIIIGDVHGCATELRELLARLNYKSSSSSSSSSSSCKNRNDGGSKDGEGDHLLVFVGDLVNKGPDPIGTLELVMESGGICVRGNHDDAAVALRHRMEKEGIKNATEASAAAAAQAASASASASAEEQKKKKKDKKKKDKAALLPVSELLTHMPWVADPRAEEGIRWLGQAPFSLRLASRGVTVVHAGLVPNSSDSSSATAVESQRLEDLLEVRHVARDFFSAAAAAAGGGEVAASTSANAAPSPSPRPSSQWRAIDKKLAKQAEKQGAHASGLSVSLWAREYSCARGGGRGGEGPGRGNGGEKLSLASSRSAGHVVFGHHASLGLQQEPSATGIDTGCVLGGELSALVLGPLRSKKGDEKGGRDERGEASPPPPPPPSSSSSSSAAGWRNLPGGGILVTVKAKRAYVGKEAADAGAEEC